MEKYQMKVKSTAHHAQLEKVALPKIQMEISIVLQDFILYWETLIASHVQQASPVPMLTALASQNALMEPSL